MPRIPSSPLRYKVGDLVCLSYDEFKLYGYGIVMEGLPNSLYRVYWFKEKSTELETTFDILPAELPEGWMQSSHETHVENT